MARYTVSDLNALAELAAAMISPEQLEEFAQAAAAIGDDYTLRNRFLMWVQDSSVRSVAGFHAWKDRGRKVRKGGRGIAILAPVTARKKDADTGASDSAPAKQGQGEAGTDEQARRVVAVRVTYVFDISQTEPTGECAECGAEAGQECDGCTSDDRSSIPLHETAPPTAEELAELLASFAPEVEDDAA